MMTQDEVEALSNLIAKVAHIVWVLTDDPTIKLPYTLAKAIVEMDEASKDCYFAYNLKADEA